MICLLSEFNMLTCDLQISYTTVLLCCVHWINEFTFSLYIMSQDEKWNNNICEHICKFSNLNLLSLCSSYMDVIADIQNFFNESYV